MVREYLEKIRKEFLEERASLMEQESILKNRMKENEKMIQMLDETNDPTYAAFTPREINPYNKNKIQELKQEQREIVTQMEQVQKKVFEYSAKIDEVDEVIKEVKCFT